MYKGDSNEYKLFDELCKTATLLGKHNISVDSDLPISLYYGLSNEKFIKLISLEQRIGQIPHEKIVQKYLFGEEIVAQKMMEEAAAQQDNYNTMKEFAVGRAKQQITELPENPFKGLFVVNNHSDHYYNIGFLKDGIPHTLFDPIQVERTDLANYAARLNEVLPSRDDEHLSAAAPAAAAAGAADAASAAPAASEQGPVVAVAGYTCPPYPWPPYPCPYMRDGLALALAAAAQAWAVHPAHVGSLLRGLDRGRRMVLHGGRTCPAAVVVAAAAVAVAAVVVAAAAAAAAAVVVAAAL
jgi:hypothetical protein